MKVGKHEGFSNRKSKRIRGQEVNKRDLMLYGETRSYSRD